MENYIPLICLIFIFVAIVLETKTFFQNLTNIPVQETELLMFPTKPIQEPKNTNTKINSVFIASNSLYSDRTKPIQESKNTNTKINSAFIPPNSLYDDPLGCPGFGC